MTNGFDVTQNSVGRPGGWSVASGPVAELLRSGARPRPAVGRGPAPSPVGCGSLACCRQAAEARCQSATEAPSGSGQPLRSGPALVSVIATTTLRSRRMAFR